MPFDLQFTDDGGVRGVGHGVVTGRDLIEANEILYDPDLLGETRYHVADLAAVERFDVSSEEIRTLAAQDVAAASVNPRLIVAVVGSEDIVFGMSRMWQIIAELQEGSLITCAVFRTFDEAMVWIHECLDE